MTLTAGPDRASVILAAAEERIAAHGYDAATVVAAALEALAEQWAEDDRPLCPNCGQRRIAKGASLCTWCHQSHEAELLHKLNWWRKNGQQWREQRGGQQ